ncbi:MAG: shikimate kinase [Candidatus Poribacteria bacterium]|nr:shikimate kinase [Candidatus Poribacteria bacterium]
MRQLSANIVLVGFMGTGKSTVGRVIAQKLGFHFIDTDDVIEQTSKAKISDIFAEHGEVYFRDLESQAVKSVALMKNQVVATGGGVVLRSSNIDLLRTGGPVFCLNATPKAIWDRVRSSQSRPLLRGPDPLKKIETLLDKRAPYYALADHQIETTGVSVDRVANEIISYIE